MSRSFRMRTSIPVFADTEHNFAFKHVKKNFIAVTILNTCQAFAGEKQHN